MKFDHNKIQLNGEDMNGNHKQTARKLKTLYQNKHQEFGENIKGEESSIEFLE